MVIMSVRSIGFAKIDIAHNLEECFAVTRLVATVIQYLIARQESLVSDLDSE